MTARSIITAAVLVSGLAASAASPTLAAGRGQTPDSILRQYESLALPTDTTIVNAEHGARANRPVAVWGHGFTAD